MKIAMVSRPVAWKLDLYDATVALGHKVHMLDDILPVEQIEAAAGGADVLIWVRNRSRNPIGDVAGLLRRLERRGVRTVGVHFDLYRRIRRRIWEVGNVPWWSCQTVWTPDDDPTPWPKGVNHRWLPPAIGDQHVGRGRPQERFAGLHVVFVGAKGYHRDHPWRRRLIEFLEKTYGKRFARFGTGSKWGRADGQTLSDLYATVPVAVGDACLAGQVRGYWSDRLPIALGRGAFMVHPAIDGMVEQGFVDGETLATFRPEDERDLKRVIDYWLDRPEERAAIVEQGMALVRERHLMTHRMATVLAEHA